MTALRRQVLTAAIEIGALLLAHALLLRLMADRHVVSTILAGGPHVPPAVIGTAGVFVLVRLAAVLLLPGIVLARVVALVMDGRERRKALHSPATPCARGRPGEASAPGER
jgi:hypothetical protein